jgi:hypothetical protein
MVTTKRQDSGEPTMLTLQPAPTLKDLRDRIDEAIEIAGEDATWNGFDDGAIYIYHPTDTTQQLAIFPRDITVMSGGRS